MIYILSIVYGTTNQKPCNTNHVSIFDNFMRFGILTDKAVNIYLLSLVDLA